MSWIEWIRQAYSHWDEPKITLEPVFCPPATTQAITEVEGALGASLPSDLVALLRETDGVISRMKFTVQGEDRVEDIDYLPWPLRWIQQRNLDMRSWANEEDNGYKPLDGYLFVADAGNGDLFGYAITNGQVDDGDIYVWNHEDDCRIRVAPSLRTFLEEWLSGKIKY